MKPKPLPLLLMLLLMLISGTTRAAASILVWPIFQFIEADQQGSALWLENRGSTPVRLQVRILAWQQVNMHDRYADQNSVIASPPFTTIPPQQRQLVRLIRTGAAPTQGEQAYRIILDEIPDASAPADSNGAGLRLQMRYVLPLFLSAPGVWTESRNDVRRAAESVSQPKLHWQLVNRQGKTLLQIRNDGIVHARLTNVFWGTQPNPAKASLLLAKGFLGYVLPGQTMQFPLPAGKTAPMGATLYAQLADNGSPVAIAP